MRAAWYWFEASDVKTRPIWETTKTIESVEDSAKAEGWIVPILDAARESAALNKKAARWTAWAVALSMISSVLGAWASCH